VYSGEHSLQIFSAQKKSTVSIASSLVFYYFSFLSEEMYMEDKVLCVGARESTFSYPFHFSHGHYSS